MIMIEKLKLRLFPCEKITARLMEGHAESARKNQEAHERLIAACEKGDENKKKCEPLLDFAFAGG